MATISNDIKSDITMYCMNDISCIENDNIVHTHNVSRMTRCNVP